MPPDRLIRDQAIIGGGLLRLLADTLVLLYKTRRLYWLQGAVLDEGLERLVCEEHAELNALCNDVAHEVVRLGVAIPMHCAAFETMSSISPTEEQEKREIVAAIDALARDHRKILADIETLRVTLPLEQAPKSAALLDTLTRRHERCEEKLGVLLPKDDETAH